MQECLVISPSGWWLRHSTSAGQPLREGNEGEPGDHWGSSGFCSSPPAAAAREDGGEAGSCQRVAGTACVCVPVCARVCPCVQVRERDRGVAAVSPSNHCQPIPLVQVAASLMYWQSGQSESIDTTSVRSWLTSIGLPMYMDSFAEAGFTQVDHLPWLTDSHYKQLELNDPLHKEYIVEGLKRL